RATDRLSASQLDFLQAVDGIRDPLVTGLQPCALPIALVGTDARAFHVAADPEAEVPPLASGLRVPAAKIAGTEPRERQLEAERVVAAIVASGAAVLERQPDVPRELVWLDEVAPPHLGGLE